jgi:hypothetical protein
MATLLHSVVRSWTARAGLAAAALGASLTGVAFFHEEPGLAAAGRAPRFDIDGDGLSDNQELVLGTQPHRSDTDGDGYSDLEEKARSSDPLDAGSIPDGAELGLGMCASQENGRVTVQWTAYIDEAKIGAIEFQVGVVRNGLPVRFIPRTYRFSRRFLRDGRSIGDRLSAIEIDIPRHMMRRLGQMTLFGVLRDLTQGTTVQPLVTSMNLLDFSGVAVSSELRSIGVGGGGSGGVMGVGYRPLAPAHQMPTSWTSGEMCTHNVAAIGMNGAYVVHEVQSADCISMDTFCSPGDCAAAVGSTLQMPDAAALAGG